MPERRRPHLRRRRPLHLRIPALRLPRPHVARRQRETPLERAHHGRVHARAQVRGRGRGEAGEE